MKTATNRKLPATEQPAPTVADRRCPCCMSGVKSWRPIVYGRVDDRVVTQARRGEVVLGGVNYGRNEPRWQCKQCETRFGRPREEFDRFGRVVSATPERKATRKIAPAWRLMRTMRLAAIAA